MKYDRMNPTLESLANELKTYASIDYGAPAYALSVAEARLILSKIVTVKTIPEELREFDVISCDDCGAFDDVRETTCPYASEVHNKNVLCCLCSACYKERIMDV